MYMTIIKTLKTKNNIGWVLIDPQIKFITRVVGARVGGITIKEIQINLRHNKKIISSWFLNKYAKKGKNEQFIKFLYFDYLIKQPT